MQIVVNSILILFLIISSIMDFKKKEISLGFCMVFLLAALGMNGFWCFNGERIIGDMFESIIPGGILIIISLMTKQDIGMGDGIVAIIIGLFIGFEQVTISLMLGFTLSALISLILLIIRRVGKSYEIPFIPFLTVGVVVSMKIV